jgi:hypothetical protein
MGSSKLLILVPLIDLKSLASVVQGLQIGGTRQGEMWANAWQESGCITATEDDP